MDQPKVERMLRMIQLLASNVEYSIEGMDGVGRFVLGLPMFVEVLEGEELREFLRDHARYILEKV